MIQKVRLSLLVLFVLGLSGCGMGHQSVPQMLALARQAIEKGDDQAAIIQLKSALQQDTQNAEIRYLLGTIYLRNGNAASAEKEIRRAFEAGYARDQTAVALANAMLGLGEYKRVVDEITVPDDAAAEVKARLLAVRGNAHLGLGETEQARALFEQSQQSSPLIHVAYLGFARLAASQNKPEDALAFVEKALKFAPNDMETLLLKAELLHNLFGQEDAALLAFKQAIAVNPKSSAARLGRASLLVKMGDIEAAGKDVEAARKVNPGALDVRYMQALVAFHGGKFALARDQLQQIFKAIPEHLPSLLLSGMVYDRTGEYALAVSQFKKVLARNPGSASTRMMLATTQVKLKQLDAALATLAPLQPEKSNDLKLLALAGNIYLRNRDTEAANRLLARAAALKPDDVSIQTGLAITRLAQGDTQQALVNLESAAGAGNKLNAADVPLIYVLMRKGEFDRALVVIDRLEKKMPNSHLVYNLRGSVYLAKQDLGNAKKSFDRSLAIKPDYATAAVNLAQIELRSNQAAAAGKRLQSFLQQHPNNPNNTEVLLALADLARRTNNKQAYEVWLVKAAAAAPTDTKPRTLLASYYVSTHEPAKALAMATEAHAARPDDGGALGVLAAVQLMTGTPQSALSSYRKLVELTPKSPTAWFKLANVQLVLKQNDVAQASLKNALALKPDYLDAQVALASLLHKSGRYAQVIEMARKMQKAFPKSANGWEIEGNAWMAQRQPSKASEKYDAAWNREKNGMLLVKWHKSMVLMGKAAEADGRLIKWLNQHPQDSASRFYLADSAQQRGNFALSNEHYAVLLKVSPNNPQFLNNYAYGLQQVRDPRALEFAERAYQLAPKNPVVMDTLASVLLDQGQATRGLKLLEQAINKADYRPEMGFHYAQALALTGDKARARSTLEMLLVQNSSFPQANAARAMLKQLKAAGGA